MWLEAHGALYSYFSSTGKKRPETQKDMEFVFRAIHHGCLAEKYQKAFELYIQKVARDIDGYITERLGLVAWDLAILSRFFTPQWKDLPTSKLTEKASFILRSRVSYCLELQGRLQEAIAERAKTINYYQREEDWEAVAHGKEKLALMLARTENLNKAKKIAEEAVTYANKARKKQPLSNDESNNIVERQLHCLSALGSICHRLGEFDVAKKHFEKAESIHIEHELDNWPDKKNEKDNIYLYSEPGCRYSALLLDMGEDIGKLRSRAIYMENWTNDQENNSERKPSYLVKAMNKLTIGRIDALGGTEECFNKAINKIDEAISLILQAHNAVYRCQPLLARADLWCQKGKYENAISDLNEVERIAGDMKLYRIDAYLMRTKIRILENDINQAWNDFYEAKECISNFEYPRCLPDFHLINAELCIYDNKSDCEWELEQAYKHSKGFKACTRNFRRDFENFCKNNGFLDMLSQ